VNVLILNHEFPPVGGGAASATAQIAKELSRLGVHVTVMTSAYNDLPRQEIQDGFSVIRVPAWRQNTLESHPHEIVSYLASALVKSLSYCHYTQPDLIHAFFGIPSGALACALNRLTRIPYLISFRGRDVHGGKGLNSRGIAGFMRAVSRIVWRRADSLVANSKGLRDIALSVDPKVEVGVIPNGVDTCKFTPAASLKRNGPLRLLYVGRLEPYKGLPDLFEALALLRSHTKTPFTLRIVGDGSLRTSLPEVACRLGLKNHICFSGAVSGAGMPGVYRNADIFVLPSIVEGMPNVVLEAMATALPTVATRIPGSEELILPGKTGFLVPPSDPQSLGDALLKLVKNETLRRDMGKRARDEAENRSWKQIAEAYSNLYSWIKENNGRERASTSAIKPQPLSTPMSPLHL